jgi:chromosome partitioning protein
MRRIAVAVSKGGVGKTTTAVNLAARLASTGKKVLLVDADTQGQTAKFLGVEPTYGLYEFLTGAGGIQRNEAIFPARKNLYLLAGGMPLVELKNWLGEQPREGRERILASKLKPREDVLDYLIFDCAPGWDILSVNILCCADEILTPVKLEGAALDGLKEFLLYVKAAKKHNPSLDLNYILPTMVDQRNRQTGEFMEQLQKHFNGKLCDPIRINVKLSEAVSFGQTIFEYSKQAAGAEDYARLARRIKNDG